MPATHRKSSFAALSLARSVFRRRVFLFLYCFLLTIAFVHVRVLAQRSDSLDDEVVRVATDLLLFPVRVRDRSGQTSTNLTEEDLTLTDKDRVTSGLYFYRGVDQVSMIFALDQSGSLREIVSQQRHAAHALFARFSERSRVAVLRFSETPMLVAPFGRDADAMRQAFNFPVQANRRTAIFNAAAAAVTAFDELPRVRSERRIVILISDGLDNASTIKPQRIIEAAFSARVSFYVIHLPLFEPRDGRLVVRGPAKGFRDLAEKTGGKYFQVGDAKSALVPNRKIDLAPVFQSIEDDLKSQYLIGFYLNETANDGRKHRFSLSVPRGFEYSVGRFGYSRTQDFFVDRPREALMPNK